MDKERRRPTSADVARLSGVSRATVSYVLNNDPRQSIPSETRRKVLEAAEALRYQPFAPARILRSGHSQIVLAIIGFEQVDPRLARDLSVIESGLAERGFSLIWHVGSHTPSGAMHPSATLTPAAVIAFVEESDPYVAAFVGRFGVPVIPMTSARVFEPVGRTQAKYLAEHGYDRMVFAAPQRGDLQKLARARLDGVREECSELGLEPPLVQMIPPYREQARGAVKNILMELSPPFGLCCYNDEVAFAAIAALSDEGVPIPESVAVIGCDDIPLAQFSMPPLTTIGWDNGRRLQGLIGNVLAASSGEPMEEIPEIVLSIIVRESA